jgi:MscS family membrane protein
MTAVLYAASAWLFWLTVRAIFERIIIFRDLSPDSFDVQILIAGSKVLGFTGSLIILATGVQALGLPIYSVVAGLGIGGLAVALAIRPTLENLIAGIILYLDQPVCVGDYCSFGDTIGTIESIGIRTTKIRALDRTLVTIPNAALADMKLVNWAKCDQMMIETTIALRYETDSDQLRYVLVKFREMLHSHPKIDGDTIRVRFAGYGLSSLDIGIRIYALTRDWNEFYAIREDVFLRMHDIVTESGSDFAFPSQMLYMARDNDLDAERSENALNEVQSWRDAGRLPFPKLSADRVNELSGTLDWPPRGSAKIGIDGSEEAEPLSSDPEAEDTNEPKR